ncbi:MAG TPA: 50S ribosomal protein L21 [Candidatus Dojkabacteria bacterium]|jgi:large subunit ribosomal protein L21|nr:50S ribosomal protein L21 [Candidatus Dojkabacteria bacterium]HOV17561.1 50S ribosomal protein L21 [Candidatus Dojkabacteria bacterium]HPM14131.1 50S ribosomal protein L21 [Candidatus Dojkabacteria bacterium]HQA87638.1 50S ribosomal protein L21 [Candidatus Dojkabacteria bacterium]
MSKNEKKEKFAVIKLGGAQLKVVEGKEYEVNKLDGKKGDKIEISEVLLLANGDDVKIGTPYVEGSKVTLEITSQKKDKKVDVFKYKAKSRYRKSAGHRSLITKVLVKKIV